MIASTLLSKSVMLLGAIRSCASGRQQINRQGQKQISPHPPCLYERTWCVYSSPGAPDLYWSKSSQLNEAFLWSMETSCTSLTRFGPVRRDLFHLSSIVTRGMLGAWRTELCFYAELTSHHHSDPLLFNSFYWA